MKTRVREIVDLLAMCVVILGAIGMVGLFIGLHVMAYDRDDGFIFVVMFIDAVLLSSLWLQRREEDND